MNEMRWTGLAGMLCGVGLACIASALKARAHARHEMTYGTVEALARTIDARDRYTAGHSARVTACTLVLARAMHVPREQHGAIRRAGMLHDIGKVAVPDDVLFKAGPLDPAERAIMESHAIRGYEMLRDVACLEDALPAIRGHHERWDGRGYPDRLGGSDIPLHARIMAVADSFDAMTSARPYRPALPHDEAARRLRAGAGCQFDPAVISAFERAEDRLRGLAAS